MRILVCNWKDLAHRRAGGAEVYAHEIASRWVRDGHQVTWFCSKVRGRPAREHVDGIEFVRAGGRIGVYRAARRYFETESRDRVDIIVDVVNTRPFGCIKWRTSIPTVALIFQVAREVWNYEMVTPAALVGRHVLEPRWLRAYRRAPVLTISASSKASLEEYGLEDVRVVPVGCADELRGGIAKDPVPTLVYVGRLTANKRPDHALRVHARVRERVPNVQLWVIGAGPRERRLRRAAGPGVVFFGHVSSQERQHLLSRAHALIVTSAREGWGLVVDEAAAAGTVAVGYNVAGLSDSIPAAGGVLVAPTPAELAAALVDRMPRWITMPSQVGWRGGAVGWDEVAVSVLAHLHGAVQATPSFVPTPVVAA